MAEKLPGGLVTRLGLASLLTLFLLAGLSAPPAGADEPLPPVLWTSPEDGLRGSEAGRVDGGEGIVADPTSGDLFFLDRRNLRVSKFTAFGVFVESWGWGVATGAAKLETCGPGADPPTATCMAGLSGSGPGQLNLDWGMGGIAIDADGNVWVGDMTNHRLQKFSPDGEFLLMVGGGVNGGLLHPGDVCTAANIAEGDICGAGTRGTGDGEFQTEEFGRYIAASPDDTILVGDTGRIQEFKLDGSFQDSVGLQGALAGRTVSSMEVDSTGKIWISAISLPDQVFKLDSSGGIILPPLEVESKAPALATDSQDNLYVGSLNTHIRKEVVDGQPLEFNPGEVSEVIKFDSEGAVLIPQGSGFAKSRNIDSQGTLLATDLATNSVSSDSADDIYFHSQGIKNFTVSFLSAYGPPPTKWLPPLHAPEITSQYALSIEEDSAVLGAEINPYFWEGTTYYVEYGTGKCSEGNCTNIVPAPPGLALEAGVVKAPRPTKGIPISGLLPGTEYHYRFVALGPGSEGEEVRGVGGKVGEDGGEASFATPTPPSPSDTACANQAFRAGPSANLPFCRAYEMVSPMEKNNTDIRSLPNFDGIIAILDQSSTSGDKFTYTTSQGMGDAQGTPYLSQYLASRGADGWSNHGITPSQGISTVEPGNRLDIEFRAFTDDLCSAVLQTSTDRLLAPGAHAGFFNLYRRQNCGTEGYETLSTLEPPPGNETAFNFVPEPQAISADGRCSVFFYHRAASDPPNPVYQSCEGDQRLVSVMPNGEPSHARAWAGGPNHEEFGIREANAFQAVSADGSRIYWSTAYGSSAMELYVRLNPDQPQSALKFGGAAGSGTLSSGSNVVSDLATTSGTFVVGQTISAAGLPKGTKITAVSPDALTLSKPANGNSASPDDLLLADSPCTEPTKACTVRVPGKDGMSSHFQGASSDGSKAFYTLRNSSSGSKELAEFTLATGKATTVATDVLGVVGLGEDATRIAFVSKKALGSGANAEGRSPLAGEPNLYLFDATRSDAERFRFIGILAPTDARDAPDTDYSMVAAQPFKRLARVSPDGNHLVFLATASLTGYDNTDAQSGKPDGEIFVYDADADGGQGRLSCVSCNPTGQRPTGRALRIEGVNAATWAAAFIPPFQTELHGSRAISEDGGHVFFNSYDRLLRSDTNGKMDVYEWQAPGIDPSEGGCTEDSPTYSPPNRGCLGLISTGKSSSDSEFLDASPSGRDVFFATQESLVAQDAGLTDIYDARAGGGFPAPPPAPPLCEGEACQPPGAVPSDPAPATSAPGAGNPPAKIRCPRGFHKVAKKGAKPKCVKNKKQKQGKGKGKRKSNKSRGAGR